MEHYEREIKIRDSKIAHLTNLTDFLYKEIENRDKLLSTTMGSTIGSGIFKLSVRTRGISISSKSSSPIGDKRSGVFDLDLQSPPSPSLLKKLDMVVPPPINLMEPTEPTEPLERTFLTPVKSSAPKKHGCSIFY